MYIYPWVTYIHVNQWVTPMDIYLFIKTADLIVSDKNRTCHIVKGPVHVIKGKNGAWFLKNEYGTL